MFASRRREDRRPPRRRQDRLPGSRRPFRQASAARPDRRPRPGGVRAAHLARPRRSDRCRGQRHPLPPRRGLAARRKLPDPRQGTAPAAGQAPRPLRRRDPLPPPRARPDLQRAGPRDVHRPSTHHLGRPRLPGRRGLHRGRDPRPAASLRRRHGAALHDAPQRPGPRPLPAHRDRALPQAAARRRSRARLRARQGLPQRGPLAQAQPRVHDGRVVRGLCRLRRRGRAPGSRCRRCRGRRRIRG